jgi:hypothetical protein|tara:strand:- start:1503 stop:2012 length:510 start_codon:yes stop_codon:yes gene_type:complete
MAISSNNITYEKIMTPLRDKLRTEFKGALPIYFDTKHQDIGTKSLRIYPTSQELQDKRTNSFMNLYNIEMDYVINTKLDNEKALDVMYKDVSRIETVLFNNSNGGSIPYFYAAMPTIEHNIDVEIQDSYVSRISVPVLYEEVHEKFVRFVTSNDKFFVLSNGSFYIVRS